MTAHFRRLLDTCCTDPVRCLVIGIANSLLLDHASISLQIHRESARGGTSSMSVETAGLAVG